MMKKDFKPYYAVIFTSTRTEEDNDGYSKMAHLMKTLAEKQDGFISIDSVRDTIGITVSYWKTLEAIAKWKQQSDHQIAQKLGIKQWYTWYNVRICKVEREYEFMNQKELQKR